VIGAADRWTWTDESFRKACGPKKITEFSTHASPSTRRVPRRVFSPAWLSLCEGWDFSSWKDFKEAARAAWVELDTSPPMSRANRMVLLRDFHLRPYETIVEQAESGPAGRGGATWAGLGGGFIAS